MTPDRYPNKHKIHTRYVIDFVTAHGRWWSTFQCFYFQKLAVSHVRQLLPKKCEALYRFVVHGPQKHAPPARDCFFHSNNKLCRYPFWSEQHPLSHECPLLTRYRTREYPPLTRGIPTQGYGRSSELLTRGDDSLTPGMASRIMVRATLGRTLYTCANLTQKYNSKSYHAIRQFHRRGARPVIIV